MDFVMLPLRVHYLSASKNTDIDIYVYEADFPFTKRAVSAPQPCLRVLMASVLFVFFSLTAELLWGIQSTAWLGEGHLPKKGRPRAVHYHGKAALCHCVARCWPSSGLFREWPLNHLLKVAGMDDRSCTIGGFKAWWFVLIFHIGYILFFSFVRHKKDIVNNGLDFSKKCHQSWLTVGLIHIGRP